MPDEAFNTAVFTHTEATETVLSGVGSDPAADLGSDAGADLGSDPGSGPGADPGSDPDPPPTAAGRLNLRYFMQFTASN